MNERDLTRIFEQVRKGELAVDQAVARLKQMPFEDLGFAKIDHHRALRQGFAEVVFARGKTPAQVAAIVRSLLRPAGGHHSVLVTRAVWHAARNIGRSPGQSQLSESAR
jgi:NCAIR mutase (PurE)-related protein